MSIAMVTSIVSDARPADAGVQPTWPCATDRFLFQHPDNADTSVYAVDILTGDTKKVFTIAGRTIDAVAYNPVDGYFYGFDNTHREIVRVGSDGSVVGLGLPGGWSNATPDSRSTGEFDADGTYWVATGGVGGTPTEAAWSSVDMKPGSPTYFQTTGTGTTTSPGGSFLSDWAFSPTGNELYSVVPNADGTGALLVRFDRATGDFVEAADLGRLVAPDGTPVGGTGGFGAIHADADGHIYAQDSGTCQIWRVDPAAGEATFFSYGPPAGPDDGPRSADPPEPGEFGDAPGSDGTTPMPDGTAPASDGAPSVDAPEPGEARDGPDGDGTTPATDGAPQAPSGQDAGTTTAPLMLGGRIATGTEGEPRVVVTTDAVPHPIVMVAGQPTTVSVTATNDTAEPATLADWIDLDGNGTFDAGELVTVTVPANSGTAGYDLTFPAGTRTAGTYARFRLFPGAVTDPLPTGAAAGEAEVEDYLVATSALAVARTAEPASGTPVEVGDTVTYTLTISNTGTSAQAGAVVTDDLAGVLDDAEPTSGPTLEPAAAGTAVIADGVMTFTGDIPAGEEVTVTYAVTVLHPSDTKGDAVLTGGEVGGQCPDPPVTDPPDAGRVVVHPVRAVQPLKEVDVEEAGPGDKVTHTITLTNIGKADYTAESPARFADDLSGVLGQATFDDGATASAGDPPRLDGATLVWVGPLAVGEKVVITYSVTVDPPVGGDAVPGKAATTPADEDAPKHMGAGRSRRSRAWRRSRPWTWRRSARVTR